MKKRFQNIERNILYVESKLNIEKNIATRVGNHPPFLHCFQNQHIQSMLGSIPFIISHMRQQIHDISQQIHDISQQIHDISQQIHDISQTIKNITKPRFDSFLQTWYSFRFFDTWNGFQILWIHFGFRKNRNYIQKMESFHYVLYDLLHYVLYD